jgi:DNA-binding beta-propeller fold protein YncE
MSMKNRANEVRSSTTTRFPPLVACACLSPLAGLAQTPVIHEPVWRLHARVPVIAPAGAHFNPVDGSIWVGSSLTAASGGAIVRINPDLSLTTIVGCDRPRAVVVDPVDGDVFFSEDYAGIIDRIGFGATTKQRWVSGFHSGDDDPCGMAIAPQGYAGPVLLPGQALVVDRGNAGPKGIWRWDPAVAEGEVLVKGDDGTMVNPLDVAVTTTEVYFVDGVPAPGRLFRLLNGGVSELVATRVALPKVGGIAVDPWNQSLLLRADDRVVRVDPTTGATRDVIEIAPIGDSGHVAGIDVTPDGRFLVLTYRGANAVYVFERAAQYTTYGSGCAGSHGIPTIDHGALRPTLCSTFRITVAPLAPASVAFGILGAQSGLLILDPLGMTGCQLLVRNDLVVPLGKHPVPGSVQWDLPIPCSSSLDRAKFYQQVFATDPAANPFGAVVSNAGFGVISRY